MLEDKSLVELTGAYARNNSRVCVPTSAAREYIGQGR